MFGKSRGVLVATALVSILALAACGGGGDSSGSTGSGSGGSGGGSSNTAPTASNGSVTTTENTAVNSDLTATDSDGDVLTYSMVGQPSHGTASITNSSTGAFTYTPTTGYSGSDSFTFKATDSAGNDSNTATETVTVNASGALAPDAPTLNSVATGNGSITLSFTAPDSDGGAAITGYTATCTADGNTSFTATGSASPISVTGMNGGVTRTCSVTATNSVGTSVASNTKSATPLSLDPEDLTHLPVGDNYVTDTTPAVGWLYVCSLTTGGGASSKGPWFNSDGTTWDETKKEHVSGDVNWPTATLSYGDSGSFLVVSGNDLPISHNTGTYPIPNTDPIHQYDGNPNSISTSISIAWNLPDDPTVQSQPTCTQGTIGFMVTGVKIFNAADAGDRDAGAWEGQDSCDGHPNEKGSYHYHTMTEQDCLPASAQDTAGQHSPVVGYAADGFPIYGNLGQDGVPLSNKDLDECHGHTHAITFNGKTVVMYHYHVTHAFPYTVGCYRGKPVHIQ
ncbi:MAG TPA: YHYH protein [Gammaproteobacteria bacterium]|nr:YHYH protein [Gammaproteobacteria bacterium]